MKIDMPGEAVDEAGNVVGHHKGYMHYTVGKRRGFYVHGAHEPHYVLRIDAEKNRIVVGKKEALSTESFEVEKLNLFDDFSALHHCEVKVRYRSQSIGCRVEKLGEDRARVVLESPVYGVAKGQIAAFYEGEKLLGGGVIL